MERRLITVKKDAGARRWYAHAMPAIRYRLNVVQNIRRYLFARSSYVTHLSIIVCVRARIDARLAQRVRSLREIIAEQCEQ